jgi:hypothetical protein
MRIVEGSRNGGGVGEDMAEFRFVYKFHIT